jgi:hydroxymethylpyrimidine/phosphomethylpyrimidine kinase
MYAKNGAPLMANNAIETLIKKIIPLAHIITPNIPEAEKIADMKIKSLKDMQDAALKINSMGCPNVLIKGGHSKGDATDILYDGKSFSYFEKERIKTKNTHGTGCTYSSAITSNLALGLPMIKAISKAKEYVTTAIRFSFEIGKGNGPTNHFYDLYKNGLN